MAKNQQLPLNPDEISGVCGRLLCCLAYEDAHYKEQNKKMPKLGAEVITPQGIARVRHVHPLKESVTVMLEDRALAEFSVTDLLTSKSSSGAGCSTCGGCTVKRRAGAEEANATAKERQSKEQKASETVEASQQREGSGGKRRRRRRRSKAAKPRGK